MYGGQNNYPVGKQERSWGAATFFAVLILILIGPFGFNHISIWLWFFILEAWGIDFGPLVFWCAWLVIIPAIFFSLRGLIQYCIKILVHWVAVRIR